MFYWKKYEKPIKTQMEVIQLIWKLRNSWFFMTLLFYYRKVSSLWLNLPLGSGTAPQVDVRSVQGVTCIVILLVFQIWEGSHVWGVRKPRNSWYQIMNHYFQQKKIIPCHENLMLLPVTGDPVSESNGLGVCLLVLITAIYWLLPRNDIYWIFCS